MDFEANGTQFLTPLRTHVWVLNNSEKSHATTSDKQFTREPLFAHLVRKQELEEQFFIGRLEGKRQRGGKRSSYLNTFWKVTGVHLLSASF